MIKAVIFDVYGTLIDTKNGSIRATEAILRENRVNFDPKIIYAEWKRLHAKHIMELSKFINEEEIFLKDLKELYRKFDIHGNAEEDIEIMIKSLLYERDAFPETMDVLEKLKSNYKIYIGSNTDTQPLLSNLNKNQIAVDNYFTSESLQTYKPKKEFFLKILELTDTKVDEVVYVGDSQVDDILGAKALGITTVWVNRKKQNLHAYIPKPNYEIFTLEELFDFL